MRFDAQIFLFSLLSLSIFACVPLFKAKEVLEGSEVWIRELTQGMHITVQYPEGEVRLHQMYDIIIEIENRSKYEPHLDTAIVEVLSGPKDLTCTMIDPKSLEMKPFASGVVFYMSPKKVVRDMVTTIRIQCAFAHPGTYKIHLAAEFRESGKPFISRVFTVTAK